MSIREYQRRYKQNLRDTRKAAGLCSDCDEPFKPGFMRCEEHLRMRRLYKKRARIRRRNLTI